MAGSGGRLRLGSILDMVKTATFTWEPFRDGAFQDRETVKVVAVGSEHSTEMIVS
jgi:hypothetical protein